MAMQEAGPRKDADEAPAEGSAGVSPAVAAGVRARRCRCRSHRMKFCEMPALPGDPGADP